MDEEASLSPPKRGNQHGKNNNPNKAEELEMQMSIVQSVNTNQGTEMTPEQRDYF